MSFVVQTECAHCSKPIHIELDSDLKYQVNEEESDPLVFSPLIDFARITDPSIIDVF